MVPQRCATVSFNDRSTSRPCTPSIFHSRGTFVPFCSGEMDRLDVQGYKEPVSRPARSNLRRTIADKRLSVSFPKVQHPSSGVLLPDVPARTGPVIQESRAAGGRIERLGRGAAHCCRPCLRAHIYEGDGGVLKHRAKVGRVLENEIHSHATIQIIDFIYAVPSEGFRDEL